MQQCVIQLLYHIKWIAETIKQNTLFKYWAKLKLKRHNKQCWKKQTNNSCLPWSDSSLLLNALVSLSLCWCSFWLHVHALSNQSLRHKDTHIQWVLPQVFQWPKRDIPSCPWVKSLSLSPKVSSSVRPKSFSHVTQASKTVWWPEGRRCSRLPWPQITTWIALLWNSGRRSLDALKQFNFVCQTILKKEHFSITWHHQNTRRSSGTPEIFAGWCASRSYKQRWQRHPPALPDLTTTQRVEHTTTGAQAAHMCSQVEGTW